MQTATMMPPGITTETTEKERIKKIFPSAKFKYFTVTKTSGHVVKYGAVHVGKKAFTDFTTEGNAWTSAFDVISKAIRI